MGLYSAVPLLHRGVSFRIHVQGQGLRNASHRLCTSKPHNENPARAYCAPTKVFRWLY